MTFRLKLRDFLRWLFWAIKQPVSVIVIVALAVVAVAVMLTSCASMSIQEEAYAHREYDHPGVTPTYLYVDDPDWECKLRGVSARLHHRQHDRRLYGLRY